MFEVLLILLARSQNVLCRKGVFVLGGVCAVLLLRTKTGMYYVNIGSNSPV
jgi:hypothetical protein